MRIEFICLSETGAQSKRFEPFPTNSLFWAVLAAQTPSSIEVVVQDENYVPLTFAGKPDLVAISVSTPSAPRAYEIGRRFRRKGAKVVYGGAHISQIQQHEDLVREPFVHGEALAVFVGDAEETWPRFLSDLANGESPAEVYTGETFDFGTRIVPKRAIYPRHGLQRLFPKVVAIESSRGCLGSCVFCCTNGRYNTKPIEDISHEVKLTRAKYYNFVDSNLGTNAEHMRLLMEVMTGKQCSWSGSAHLPSLKGKAEMLKASGCELVYIGFESVIPESAAELHKPYINAEACWTVMNELHHYGIAVVGSFVFGFDHDDDSVFERTLEFASSVKLDDASFHILMPYPGTEVFRKFRQEGRLKYTNYPEDWGKYSRGNVVYEPKLMSADALERGYKEVVRSFYSIRSICHRLRNPLSSKKATGIALSNMLKWARTRRHPG